MDQFRYSANLRRRRGDSRYPEVRTNPIRFVTSDPDEASAEERDDCELIQLTDILLGAAETALEFRQARKYSGRLQLARSLAAAMAEHWGGEYLTYSRRARNFTVTLWPDNFGFTYPALPVRQPTHDTPRMPLPGSLNWELRGKLPPWPDK